MNGVSPPLAVSPACSSPQPQAALGELTYESDAAEKLRLEVRAATNRCARLQEQLAAASEAVAVAQAARAEADKLVETVRRRVAVVGPFYGAHTPRCVACGCVT